MDVVVITSSERSDNEIENIIDLFEQGLTTLHVRKPKLTTEEIERFIRCIPESYHNRIVVHGHYELALRLRLKGIHLQRSHREPTFKNRFMRLKLKLKGRHLTFSATFRSLQSLVENKRSFDYVFLGPVFTSHAHYHLDDPATVNSLKSQLNRSTQQVYAIGGVDESRMMLLNQAGFNGVGLSGCVWRQASTPGFGSLVHRFQAA